jgi:hypothetical protein
MAEGRVRGFSIATKCATLEELIEKFRDRVDETSILVNTVESRDIGTECAFAILLADKKVALAGTCTVMAVFTDANNPFKRPGMRLGIEKLGPASEKVWAELVAKRISPRKMTTVVPVIPIPNAKDAPPIAIARTKSAQSMPPRTTTMSIPVLAEPRTKTATRGSSGAALAAATATPVREAPRRLATVQIPPTRDSQRTIEPLPEAPVDVVARAPRGTPRTLEDQKPLVAAPAAVETRTPGSSYILPANPLMNLTDRSLEGFVECKIGEAIGTPEAFPIGTADELDAVEPSEPMRAAMEAEPLAKRPSDLAIPAYVEPARSEPLSLPPPPPRSAPIVREPRPLVLQRSTELPRLPVVSIEDGRANSRVPLLSRRARILLLLSFLIAPVVGAASVIGYMHFTKLPVVASPTVTPVVTDVADAMRVHGTVGVESPPPEPEPVVAPKPQPLHAVFVQSYPIAAQVTVGGLSFGTTPTYIKIPANTPVELSIARAGFKPVKQELVSTHRFDRVFVRLQRAPKGGR